MKSLALLFIMALTQSVSAFSTIKPAVAARSSHVSSPVSSSTSLNVADLDTVALVAGQENYGFAAVALGEALWSFGQAPSFSNAKVFIPAVIAAGVLGAVSGPMITSGDASSAALGLEIATGVTVLLGASYLARLLAPFSPSPKEIPFLGLLFAIAGFIAFSQNLVVDGFVTLPNLPSIPLPQIPLGLGEDIDTSYGL
mmetsp:Transcript_10905/g.17985  ORF Transcript_10905/g.17985 Transcript_10905/m.17985 type:complete len:198 (-) Transcript_10905:89-682(-)